MIAREIENKATNGIRISEDEAVWLYREASLSDLGRWATISRDRYFPREQATYLIMRIINHTNVCVAFCDYCAFFVHPKDKNAYVLSDDIIFSKIDELIALGGGLVGFNGGFHPQLKIEWYGELFKRLLARYREQVQFYVLTVAELMYVAKNSKLSYYDAASYLKECGISWITGGGAEILTNEFRKRHSPLKYSADEYLLAQREIIRAGVGTTGTMVIGFDETVEERVEHLQRIRRLQDETQGLTSFLSWTYKPYGTRLAGREICSEEYLRHLAVARLYLDNIKHIRTSVLTQNESALRGLRFGADDFDIPLEDEVTEKAGATINRDIAAILESARRQGFDPIKRQPFAAQCM